MSEVNTFKAYVTASDISQSFTLNRLQIAGIISHVCLSFVVITFEDDILCISFIRNIDFGDVFSIVKTIIVTHYYACMCYLYHFRDIAKYRFWAANQ